MHEERLRCLVAKRAQPGHARCREVDQADAFARGKCAHRRWIRAMRVQQLVDPAAALELAARQRGDQDRCRPLRARQRHVARQPLRERLRRFVVARRVLGLFVVVAELDQQHVATRQRPFHRRQPAFLDEAARTAPGLRVVAYLPRGGVEEGLQLHAPALARRAFGAVFAGGGIANDEDLPGRNLPRLRGWRMQRRHEHRGAPQPAASAPASHRRPG